MTANSSCSNCATTLPAGSKFCFVCGAKIAPPQSSRPPQPSVCGKCGTALVAGAKFCVNCGQAASSDVIQATEILELSSSAVIVEAPKEPQTVAVALVAPPPPAQGKTYTFGGSGTAAPPRSEPAVDELSQPAAQGESAPPVNLPPSQNWAFQDSLTTLAAKAVTKLDASHLISNAELRSPVTRLIRAALLDKDVYREVAADESSHAQSWQVALLLIVISSIGWILIASLLSASLPSITLIAGLCLVQLMAWLVRVWVVQFAGNAWLKSRVDFKPLFRALTFAQAPAMLQIIPVIGQLTGLWCLVTTTAAIRDVTGCDTAKAIALTILGVIGVAVTAFFVGSLI